MAPAATQPFTCKSAAAPGERILPASLFERGRYGPYQKRFAHMASVYRLRPGRY